MSDLLEKTDGHKRHLNEFPSFTYLLESSPMEAKDDEFLSAVVFSNLEVLGVAFNSTAIEMFPNDEDSLSSWSLPFLSNAFFSIL